MNTLDKMKWITRPRSFECGIVRSMSLPHVDDTPVVREIPQPEGKVIGFTGRRRRGKSLSMVTMGYLMRQIYHYPILANFSLDYMTGLPDAETEGLYTGRFTLEEIITFPECLKDCVILWDEIDRIFLSKRSTTLVSEFLENGLNLLGKRNIWLFWACQNIRRINGSLFFQTDYLWECDSRNKGHDVPITMTDLHGASAPQGTQRFKVLKNTWLHKKRYNTREMFDPLERLSVRIDRSKGAKAYEDMPAAY